MGIEITNDELPWDSIDTFALKTFLATRAGLRLVPKILQSVSPLLEKGEINEILIRSGSVQGFSRAVTTLLALAEPPAKEQPAEPSAYPQLTDDAAWNDGQSLAAKHTIPHA